MSRAGMRSIQRKLAGTLLLLALVCFGNAGAETVDNETCLDCHDEYDRTLLFSAHTLHESSAGPGLRCISCHAGAEIHIDDPEIGNIVNPAREENNEIESICSQCHQPHLGWGTTGIDPHHVAEITCTACHKIHSPNDPTDNCQTCHVAVKSSFRQRSSHPLIDDAVGCIDCHSFGDDIAPSVGHGFDANCSSCHPEHSGPYLFEHGPVSSFATEGEGCIACHQPHGSPNDFLLRQPDDRLCMQCHGRPPRHQTQHGGIGRQYSCMTCHTDIHGSYENRALLDPLMSIVVGGMPDDCNCHYGEDR